MIGSSPSTDSPQSVLPRPRVVLTIGKLDGVHAGHRHLAAHAQAVADRLGAQSAAVVLHPDPTTVLAGRHVPRLTTIEDRAARLRSFGVEIVEPWRFTTAVAQMTPVQFIDQLVDRFEIAAMVIGPDFAFGRDRAGDLETLVPLADRWGFDVHVVPPLAVAGEWVSSRRIRTVIEDGDIELARTLLRAPPRVVGTVVHGAARGRQLGFPTANLDPTADFALPANGIYTVVARWYDADLGEDHVGDGVASVGVRPTFDNGARLLEVHLVDFDGELYGREMTVDFLERQRPELRFEDIGALIEQMTRDTTAAVAAHALESSAPWTLSRTGAGSCILGHDLAALCERAVAFRLRSECRALIPHRGERSVLSLTGSSRQQMFDAWLAQLSAGIVQARVYEAGDTTLHALVRVDGAGGGVGDGDGRGDGCGVGRRVGGGDGAGDADREADGCAELGDLVSSGPIRDRDDGWLEVDVAVERI